MHSSQGWCESVNSQSFNCRLAINEDVYCGRLNWSLRIISIERFNLLLVGQREQILELVCQSLLSVSSKVILRQLLVLWALSLLLVTKITSLVFINLMFSFCRMTRRSTRPEAGALHISVLSYHQVLQIREKYCRHIWKEDVALVSFMNIVKIEDLITNARRKSINEHLHISIIFMIAKIRNNLCRPRINTIFCL